MKVKTLSLCCAFLLLFGCTPHPKVGPVKHYTRDELLTVFSTHSDLFEEIGNIVRQNFFWEHRHEEGAGNEYGKISLWHPEDKLMDTKMALFSESEQNAIWNFFSLVQPLSVTVRGLSNFKFVKFDFIDGKKGAFSLVYCYDKSSREEVKNHHRYNYNVYEELSEGWFLCYRFPDSLSENYS